ncbi:MAG: response regulator [Candidatus Izemoplasma sp.]
MMASILCVENSETIRKVVKDSVLDLGFEFYDASNGEEMFEVIKGLDQLDLVIIDWNMPVMSGPESIKRLRAISKFKNTAILVMIKVENKDQVMDAFDIGANYYVLKPFRINVFQEEIKEIIRKNAE